MSITIPMGAARADVVQDALAYNKRLDSVSGKFSQTVTGDKKVQKAEGTFAIMRPGYYKWHYEKPYKQDIIKNDEGLFLYDMDLEQVTKRKPGADAGGSSPAQILATKDALTKHYKLEADPEYASKEKLKDADGLEFLRAIPLDKDNEYRDIRLGFKAGDLARMYLIDEFGNKIEIRLEDVKENPSLKAGDFAFKIPKGVDVFEE